MKAYIIYIATLLAALALPLAAQTGGTATKAAPDKPAMPYKLTTVTTGGNNGTVAVEDNTSGGSGVVVAGNDTLVYGASEGNNATTVKLTVTPNNGYTVRKGYPKAYKTGVTVPQVPITGDNSSHYTFTMPGYPVTVEVAYAHRLSKIGDITLKESKQEVGDVIKLLPQYVPIVLANGRKDSLQVSGWTYESSDNNSQTGDNNNSGTNGEYNADQGAVNVFTFTLATALPDSIADAETPLLTESNGSYTGKVKVANMAEPLVPEEGDKDKGITISGGTGDNLNSKTEGDNGNGTPFDGTIDGSGTEIKSIEVSSDVKDATLTLKDVTVSGGTNGTTDAKTEIKDGADVTLKLEGNNTLGTLTVGKDASITLKPEAGAQLNGTKIENSGTFIDSTATVTKVEGTGALDINANLAGGGNVTTNTTVTLTSTVNDRAGTTHFIWQQKQADGSYTDVATNQYDESGAPVTTKANIGITDTYTPPTDAVGTAEYRCLVKRIVDNSGGGPGSTPAITLLSTKSTTVVVKSGSTPPPPVPVPNYYTVTLPSVEGFTTKPAAGNHSVEEGYSFRFSLILPEDYTGNAPAVTTSRGETLEPRESDGKYIIRNVTEDITVEIAGLPTANVEVTADGIRIECHAGSVHIHTPEPAATAIYTLTGYRLRQLSLPAGDHRIGLPQGAYVVVAGDKRQKLIVR